jgi:hypothetical protein
MGSEELEGGMSKKDALMLLEGYRQEEEAKAEGDRKVKAFFDPDVKKDW